MRGVAAFVVISGHALADDRLPTPHLFYLGVDFFFMLSGFVVTYAHEERLRARTMAAWAFVELRVARLHPLLVAAVAIAVVRALLGGLIGATETPLHLTRAAAATALFCIPWDPIVTGPDAAGLTAFAPNGPEWSLLYEYALSLFFVAFVPRLRGRRIALVAAVAAVLMIVMTRHAGRMDVGSARGDWMLAPPRALDAFAIGILIRRLEIAALLPRFSRPFRVQALLLLGVLLWPGPSQQPTVQIVALAIVLPLIILGGRQDLFGPRARGIMLWAGGISYPLLYILHVPIMHPIARVFKEHLPIADAPIAYGVQIVATLFIAQLALTFFDIPVRRWLGGRIRRRAARRALATAA